MKIKKITFLFFLFTLFLNSQKDTTQLISEYDRLLSKNQDSALTFCNRLINVEKNEEKAYGLAGKAYVYTLQSKFDLADVFFEKATQQLKNYNSLNKNDIRANVFYLHALSQIEQHQLESSIITLNDALNICSKNCSFMLNIRLRSTLARAYSLANKHLEALATSHVSLKKIKKEPLFSTNLILKKEYAKELIKASNRSINLYLSDTIKHLSYLDSTKNYTALCNEFSMKHLISNYKGSISVSNADINFYQKKYAIAKQYYEKGLIFFKNKNRKKRVEQILFKIAECEYFLNNNSKAEVIILKQIENNIWSQFHLLEYEATSYYYLFKINERKQKHTEALNYASKYGERIRAHLKIKNASDLSVNDIVHNKEKQKEIKSYLKNYNIQKKQNKIYLYFLFLLIIIICFISIYFFFLKKRDKENINNLNLRIKEFQNDLSKQSIDTSKGSSLTDESALKLLKKLKTLEKDELFLQPNYTLNMVTKKLQTNSSYLSKTVNKYLGVTFVEYTNKLKINSILFKLEKHKNLRNYTIDALAQEAGYKSANSFNSNFKKILKVTPSQYLKELKKK